MFLILLVATLLLALAVSWFVARMFSQPLDRILKRIIADEISVAWLKYLEFAILVVGVSAGVRIHELERYITPSRYDKDATIIDLTMERWVLELYRTVIEALQGIAWMLLVFFVFALIAYVIVRISELKKSAALTVLSRDKATLQRGRGFHTPENSATLFLTDSLTGPP